MRSLADWLQSWTAYGARRRPFLLLHLEAIDYESQVVKPFGLTIPYSCLLSLCNFKIALESVRFVDVFSVHVVMHPDDLLIVCERLNTPSSQALTQVYLSALCAVLGQQPDTANFCDSFRCVPLLDLNGLHIFSHLYMADMNILINVILFSTLLRRKEVALEHLCLKNQRDRRESLFLDISYEESHATFEQLTAI